MEEENLTSGFYDKLDWGDTLV